MQRFINLFPKKLSISLITMLIAVELLVYLTGRLTETLRLQIQSAKQDQERALVEVKQRIQAETAYIDFLHFLALRTLYADRHSVLDDVDWLTQALPRAVRLNAFSYDPATKQLTLAGRVSSLPVFFRVARYFDERSDLTNLKRTQELNDRDGSVTIGIEARRAK